MMHAAPRSLRHPDDPRVRGGVKGKELGIGAVQFFVSHAVHDAHEPLYPHLALLLPPLHLQSVFNLAFACMTGCQALSIIDLTLYIRIYINLSHPFEDVRFHLGFRMLKGANETIHLALLLPMQDLKRGSEFEFVF
jgi:hypothetical protein